MEPNDLITSYIPLVKSVANKLNVPQLKDDLVSEGYVALTKAAQKFDSERGVSFGHFAKKCIRNAMLNYLRKDSRNDDDSLDGRDDKGVPYLNKLGNDGQAADYMLRDELRHHLHPVEEWVIIRHYFHKDPFNDIATNLGFKVSRISLIHRNALRKLRKVFGNAGVTEPQEEGDDHDQLAALLPVVRKMFWDEWGLEVCEG